MLSNYYSYSPSHVSIPYSYRYGFNGQERELQLNQSVTSAEYWFYDGRLGRRWNVEPLIHNYAFISSYACFNNIPIRYVDIEGSNFIDNTIFAGIRKVKGVLVLFNESHVTAGGLAATYAYALWQKGRIYDQTGVTFFQAYGFAAGITNKNNEPIVAGADVDLLDFGAIYSKQLNKGVDFLNGRAPFNIDVGPVDVAFEEAMGGVSVGIGEGFGLTKLNYTSFTSFSVTQEEQKKLQGLVNWNNGVDASTIEVRNVVKMINAETGEESGKRGELYIYKQGLFKKKGEWVATGINVSFSYDDTSDDKKMIIWKSDNYRQNEPE